MAEASPDVVVAKPAPPYLQAGGLRDLRIDFMRGVVLCVLLVVHFEVFSLLTFLAWERFGLIAGAEGFVILSGTVLGMVHRRTLAVHGWQASLTKLFNRAAQLYRVNVSVIASIALLALLPFLNLHEVMTFTDRGSGQVFPLYPPAADPLPMWIAKIASLKATPHQIQILGLYVFLLALCPVGLWLMKDGRTKLMLGLSWFLYFFNVVEPHRLTGAQFEYAFPLLTWQLLFFHGLAVGYHWEAVTRFFKTRAGKAVIAMSFVLFLVFLFLAQNTPNPALPAYSRLSVVPPDLFNTWYGLYFRKDTLGLGRLLNYAAALVVAFTVLTKFWKPIDKVLGWFFIPLGQATLYVFIVHVYLILIVTQWVKFGQGTDHLGVNTLLHVAVLATLWLMVRFQVLFRWIPR